MVKEISVRNREVALYIENAKEMLGVAQLNLDNGFYASAVNRAYYAIFYAANAMLATKGLARNKHSGVMSAFRQYFVKTNKIEKDFSNIYGRVFEDRNISDYDIHLAVEVDQVSKNLDDAKRFVERVDEFLRQEKWL